MCERGSRGVKKGGRERRKEERRTKTKAEVSKQYHWNINGV